MMLSFPLFSESVVEGKGKIFLLVWRAIFYWIIVLKPCAWRILKVRYFIYFKARSGISWIRCTATDSEK